MTAFSLVCLDADDTLWRNEVYFRTAERHLADVLRPWAKPELVAKALLDTERANIPRYGYGAKAFVLSMIETALSVTDHQLPTTAITELLELGKGILDQPVELLDDVADVVIELGQRWPLVLITKGDIVHQEAKILQSGLAAHFRGIEIVAHKNRDTYRQIFHQYGTAPEMVVMVGNSVASDVVPVFELGGRAVHVPHAHAWELEAGTLPNHARVRSAERFSDVIPILNAIASAAI